MPYPQQSLRHILCMKHLCLLSLLFISLCLYLMMVFRLIKCQNKHSGIVYLLYVLSTFEDKLKNIFTLVKLFNTSQPISNLSILTG